AAHEVVARRWQLVEPGDAGGLIAAGQAHAQDRLRRVRMLLRPGRAERQDGVACREKQRVPEAVRDKLRACVELTLVLLEAKRQFAVRIGRADGSAQRLARWLARGHAVSMRRDAAYENCKGDRRRRRSRHSAD